MITGDLIMYLIMYLNIDSNDLIMNSLLESLSSTSINRYITISCLYIYRGTWFADDNRKRVLKIRRITVDRLDVFNYIRSLGGIEFILCGFITQNYNIDFYLKYLKYHNIEYNLDYNEDGSINWEL